MAIPNYKAGMALENIFKLDPANEAARADLARIASGVVDRTEMTWDGNIAVNVAALLATYKLSGGTATSIEQWLSEVSQVGGL